MYRWYKTGPQLELLAPAGDDDSLRAAVANGADAVYFGVEDFNARRRASNFTLAGLPETMRWLHGRNVKGYVAFNTLVLTDELERAADYVRGIIEARADAIIVQDLGLARFIRRMSPTFPIHASTQMTQTHSAGLTLLRDLGISRAILARELSLTEIEQVAVANIMELEVFVHGAICVSYSGQCLASESLWGRSGNRGVCGQACRLPYELVVDGKPMPQDRGAYLLSPHDLAAYDRIGELARAGVTAFKIEGRLKNAEYVALTTRLYRQAIDAAVRGERFSLSPDLVRDLAQSFSRGFTHGFLDGDRHQELIGAKLPRSRGILLGTVAKRTAGGIVIRGLAGVCDAIKPGDGVVFACDDEDEAQGGRVYSVARLQVGRPGQEQQYELRFGRDDLDLRLITIGSEVFKTDDPATRRRIESSYARDRVVRPIPVTASVRVAAGERMLLTLTDDDGREVQVWSDDALSVAQRHPVTIDALREQLSRLGDTPFVLTDLTLTGPAGRADSQPVMVPKSVLNQMRRRAASELVEARDRATRHAVHEPEALAAIRYEAQRDSGKCADKPATGQPVCLHVLARNMDQFTSACESAADSIGDVRIATVYADLANAKDLATAADIARLHNVAFGLATPQVLKLGEESLLDAVAGLCSDVWLVRNLAALQQVRERWPMVAWVADFSLNVANDITAAVLAGQGAIRITPGYDLNIEQLSAIVSQSPGIEFELIAHAHVPMFHMAHCIAAAGLSKGNSCRDCGQPCSRHVLHLRDRNGEDHLVRVDTVGRTTIFNHRPQSIAACRRFPKELPVRHWRVELLDEDGPTTSQLLGLYRRLLGLDPTAAKELRRISEGMLAGTLEHA